MALNYTNNHADIKKMYSSAAIIFSKNKVKFVKDMSDKYSEEFHKATEQIIFTPDDSEKLLGDCKIYRNLCYFLNKESVLNAFYDDKSIKREVENVEEFCSLAKRYNLSEKFKDKMISMISRLNDYDIDDFLKKAERRKLI